MAAANVWNAPTKPHHPAGDACLVSAVCLPLSMSTCRPMLGTLFCVGNLCPHIGTPMSEGADVIGDVIVCPLHGSSFKTTNGELIDWCPSPPIIGPLTGILVDKKNLLIFDVRSSLFGGDIEVLVDTNAKKAYEANYWKGLLDAQGKNDGTYY